MAWDTPADILSLVCESDIREFHFNMLSYHDRIQITNMGRSHGRMIAKIGISLFWNEFQFVST